LAGIYIHIPFCKQACTYCNFYFVNTTSRKEQFIQALLQEIERTAAYLQNETIKTIYFGGGTPSLLDRNDWERIFEQLYKYHLIELEECTIEVNPDDLSAEKLHTLKAFPVNRLSIGVQSFQEVDLRFMHRAHNAIEAEKAILSAQDIGFNNITIDLIYGTPTLSMEQWEENLNKADSLGVQHLSCYALTVEPKTKLFQAVKKGLTPSPNEEKTTMQFDMLMHFAQTHQFQHYEISNFGKENYIAIHNTNYWRGEKYLGLGPSAHSFNHSARRWNISNLNNYINAINLCEDCFTEEQLSEKDRTNEYIMTSLRTQWGCDLRKIPETFSEEISASLKKITTDFYLFSNNHLILTQAGKHFADYIASELFIL
jgi:oxygen-independent coproporphyrinogen-3 oxidase